MNAGPKIVPTMGARGSHLKTSPFVASSSRRRGIDCGQMVQCKWSSEDLVTGTNRFREQFTERGGATTIVFGINGVQRPPPLSCMITDHPRQGWRPVDTMDCPDCVLRPIYDIARPVESLLHYNLRMNCHRGPPNHHLTGQPRGICGSLPASPPVPRQNLAS